MIQFLRQILNNIIDFLQPDRYFAWQTVLYMSLFSWLLSLLAVAVDASNVTITLLTTFSWIFLALGVGWGVEKSNIKIFGLSISPWLAGGILCLFLFGTWSESWFKPALAAWPLISFLVVALPNIIAWDLTPKLPKPEIRQKLILLFFLSLLFSGWFLFYFRIQSWFQTYPSLAAENLDNSYFVYRLPTQPTALSPGVTQLTIASEFVQEQLNGKPWSWTERWLLNLEGKQHAMQQQVHSRLRQQSPEDSLWNLKIRPVANGEGYDLKIQAVWNGPAAHENGYYLEKNCLLMPVNRNSPYQASASTAPDGTSANDPSPTVWANVVCDLETQRHSGHPQN